MGIGPPLLWAGRFDTICISVCDCCDSSTVSFGTILHIYLWFIVHFPIGLDFLFITFLLQECLPFNDGSFYLFLMLNNLDNETHHISYEAELTSCNI